MARRTRLRMLAERAVVESSERDERPVAEAFPRLVPQTDDIADPLGQDVLDLLRRSHERMSGEVAQATAVSQEAANRAETAGRMAANLETRQAEVEAKVDEIGNAAITALQKHAGSVQVAAREKLAATAGLVHRVSSFALDRLPALLSLAGGFWLWDGILGNPQPMQLGALGLYGACVIGPAIWLSSRAN